MAKTISAWEARRQFGKLLRDVSKNQPYVVESHGEPVAAVVPIHVFRNWQRDQQQLLDILHKASANANLTEEEAMELALEAQSAVRAGSRM